MSHGASCHEGSLKKNYLLKRIIGHILDVSVNANSFPVQYFVIASAALTRDRVLHFLPRKTKFYSLNFHVIRDIKHLFQCNKLLYYLKVFFYRTRGLLNNINISNMAAIILLQIKKNDAGAGCHKFHGASCRKLCVCVCVCVCVLQHHSRIHHTSPETMHVYVYIKRKCLSLL